MKRDSGVWLKLMLVAFVANGVRPFGLKVLSGALAFISRRFYVARRELVYGALMGVCSLCGQASTGLALSHGVPGYIAFPLTTGGSLFLVAAAGVFLFKEKVGRYGATGIALGIVALVMLSAA